MMVSLSYNYKKYEVKEIKVLMSQYLQIESIFIKNITIREIF